MKYYKADGDWTADSAVKRGWYQEAKKNEEDKEEEEEILHWTSKDNVCSVTEHKYVTFVTGEMNLKYSETLSFNVRSDVLTSVAIKITVIWDVIPCSLTEIY
jgi:phage terminase Nu1 subunit (DNA packaging protein)